MEADFWHQKWQDHKIGFHQQKINSRLIRYWPSLGLEQGSTVFVPLCGKTTDMIWLLEQGYQVIGAELSKPACQQFFTDNALDYTETNEGCSTTLRGDDIVLYAGNVYGLDRGMLDRVAGVFDRAALVALPPDMRRRYASHLASVLASGTCILLLTMEYDESKMDGPPFSVSEPEIWSLFFDRFEIRILGESSGEKILGNLKDRGLDDLREQVFLLTRR